MAQLLDLSVELSLCIASHLRQVDLLNISLTCKRLREATEPELFRQYSNPKPHTRPILPFLKKLLDGPELAKYVRRIEVKGWGTLADLNPVIDDRQTEASFDKYREPEPDAAEYKRLTQAAQTAGIISSIYPYESESAVIKHVKAQIGRGRRQAHLWYQHAFDPNIGYEDIPYDRRFCQLLRAGVEDSYVVLLLALLPGLRELFLQEGPCDVLTLKWRIPHQFPKLRLLRVCAQDGMLTWPVAFFHKLLKTKQLEAFECYCGGSWFSDLPGEETDLDDLFFPLSLQPTTVHVQKLVLQLCGLGREDMKKLLDACIRLKSFYFSLSHADDAEIFFSPGELVEMLEPHKNHLEELSMDFGYYAEHELIQSLYHFSALKVLDSVPDMWTRLEEDEFEDENPLQDKEFIDRRLPPSLERLSFHNGGSEPFISTSQIRRVMTMPNSNLPNLRYLFIGSDDPDYREELKMLWSISRTRSERFPDPIAAELGSVVARPSVQSCEFKLGSGLESPVNTFFDVTPRTRDLPETRWFESKYAVRKRKPTKLDVAWKAFMDEHRGKNLSDQELLDLSKELEIFHELKENPKLFEEREYESSDCDE